MDRPAGLIHAPPPPLPMLPYPLPPDRAELCPAPSSPDPVAPPPNPCRQNQIRRRGSTGGQIWPLHHQIWCLGEGGGGRCRHRRPRRLLLAGSGHAGLAPPRRIRAEPGYSSLDPCALPQLEPPQVSSQPVGPPHAPLLPSAAAPRTAANVAAAPRVVAASCEGEGEEREEPSPVRPWGRGRGEEEEWASEGEKGHCAPA